ncbi:glycosyltransferase family 2 protein [Flavobacterium sp. W22_SRS_FP1]|uniref:glycosyltransferase family 2 protein n=1 Tax=Flavobacterium sp. W22_SRS_FP1 TaxID=3240276 RepID=UPI003F8E2321
MKLCVLIPAKNEEGALNETISNIYKELNNHIQFNILVINDYSDDKTESVLIGLSSKYTNLSFVNNRFDSGVGNAIKYGLERWEGDIVVICMADASDSPIDILASYYKLIEGDYDCIFGSRFITGSSVINYPIIKLLLNRIFNNTVKLITKNNFNDFTNIFKMYNRKAIKAMAPIESDGFSIGLEMSLKAFSNKLNIGYIPISWKQRTSGKSKLKLVKNVKLYMLTLVRCIKYAK